MGSVVYWSYNAGLVSLLTVEKLDFPIQNLRDILNRTDYYLLIEDGTSYYSYFSDACKECEVAQALYQRSREDQRTIKLFTVGNILSLTCEALQFRCFVLGN